MKKRTWSSQLLCIAVSSLLVFGSMPISNAVSYAQGSDSTEQGTETVLVSNDFEDGTIQGWSTNNPDIIPTVADTFAYNGNKSLLYPRKINFWDSPTYDLSSKIKNGDKLKLTAWVYYDTGADEKTFQVTVDQVKNGVEGWAQFEGTQGVVVPKGQWTKLEGTYVVPTSGTISKFIVYPEYSSTGNEGFYLDDVEIVNEGATPNGISSDFEDQSTQGWSLEGSPGASIHTFNEGHTGDYSLLTTGRQAFYDRPTYELKDKLIKGNTYQYTAWVKFNGTGVGDTRKISMFTKKVDTEHPDGEYESPTGSYGVVAQSGQWTKVEGVLPFDFSGTLSSYSLYIDITDENPYSGADYNASKPFVDLYMDDVTVKELNSGAPVPIQTDIPDLYKQFDFPIGAALAPYQLDDPLHAQLIAKHFNSLVAENAMKFGSVEPQENKFDFSGPDKLVDFAIANNMKVRGHNLVWYMGMPDWVFKHSDGTQLDANNPDDKQLLLDRLKNHITQTIKHFDEKYGVYGEEGSTNPIYCWDVVNEPINDVNGGFRDNDPWYQILGTEYIEKAFEYAHEANPNIKLFLNEYNLEDPAKGQGIYNLAKSLVDKGVPIDGVGNQLHISLNSPSMESMRSVIDKFAELGLEYQVTELDVTTEGHNDENTLVKQGYRYKALFEMFKEEAAAGKLTGVTFWGLADDHSYQNTLIPGSDPLFFDEKLQVKPAYWGVVDPSKLQVYIQTASIPQGAPKLDKSLDSLWYTVSSALNGNNIIKGSETPANIRLMWDVDYLYVLAEVKDSTVSDKDGIEIFIDRNNSKQTSYEADDSHYSVKRSGENGDGITAVSTQTNDGYVLQMQIPINSINPVQGSNIGFDFRVNDYSVNETPDSVTTWNDTTNSMDTDTSKYGVLSLSKSAKMTEVVKGSPSIDGQIDPIWQTANRISTDQTVMGVNPAKASVKTLWDDNYLYVLADVTDPLMDKSGVNPWEQDSVEIFVDENNAKTTSYQTDDAQYRVNFDNVATFNRGNQELFKSSTLKTDHGYVVEMAIPLTSANINSGRVIGFDVQVNDASGGSRKGVSTWSDTTGTSYKDTSVFGNARLINPAVTNPVVSNTTLTNIDSSDTVDVNDGTISVLQLAVDSTTHEAKATIEKKVILQALENAKADLSGNKVIGIKVPSAQGVSSYSVELPVEFLSSDLKNPKLQVITEFGTVILPANMLENTDLLTGSNNVEIVIGSIDPSQLDEGVSKRIGNHPMVNLSLRVNNKTIEWSSSNASVIASIPYIPSAEELMNPNGIVVWYINDDGEMSIVNNARYDDGTKQVVFTTSHYSKYAVGYVSKQFADLGKYKWAETAIEAMAAREVLSGESNVTFSPGAAITRGEFLSSLIKILELDAVVGSNFTDVEVNDPYYEQIGIAKKLGISAGKSNNKFYPDSTITRQEMMTLTARALKAANRIDEAGTDKDLSRFKDNSQIADYARDSVATLVHNGIINGSNNLINPAGNTSRAEAAVIMYKLWNNQ